MHSKFSRMVLVSRPQLYDNWVGEITGEHPVARPLLRVARGTVQHLVLVRVLGEDDATLFYGEMRWVSECYFVPLGDREL